MIFSVNEQFKKNGLSPWYSFHLITRFDVSSYKEIQKDYIDIKKLFEQTFLKEKRPKIHGIHEKKSNPNLNE